MVKIPESDLDTRAGPRLFPFEQRHLPHLVVLFICTVILAAAFVLSPAGTGGRHLHFFSLQLPDTCSFLDLTGLPCPGCGLTRSVVSAVHGDLVGSWDFHRLGMITLFYILLQAMFRVSVLAFSRGAAAIFGDGTWLNRGLIWLAILYGINWLISLALLL